MHWMIAFVETSYLQGQPSLPEAECVLQAAVETSFEWVGRTEGDPWEDIPLQCTPEAPSPAPAGTVPSASLHAVALACAEQSCKSSKAWQWEPRSARSRQSMPETYRCPATSPWLSPWWGWVLQDPVGRFKIWLCCGVHSSSLIATIFLQIL